MNWTNTHPITKNEHNAWRHAGQPPLTPTCHCGWQGKPQPTPHKARRNLKDHQNRPACTTYGPTERPAIHPVTCPCGWEGKPHPTPYLAHAALVQHQSGKKCPLELTDTEIALTNGTWVLDPTRMVRVWQPAPQPQPQKD